MSASRWLAPWFLLPCLAGAAAAQVPLGTRDPEAGIWPGRGEAARTDHVFRGLIACLVARDPGRARNLVASIPGSALEARIAYSFRSRIDQCLPGAAIRGLAFPGELLRGGIAELFYRRAFPAGLPERPTEDADGAAAWARPRAAENMRVPQLELLHAMARCAVLRRPATVSELMANPPLSEGERRAFEALRETLSTCIESGVTSAVPRQSLRGLLAEAALHHGEAHRTGSAR
jgi:hypothetical protein